MIKNKKSFPKANQYVNKFDWTSNTIIYKEDIKEFLDEAKQYAEQINWNPQNDDQTHNTIEQCKILLKKIVDDKYYFPEEYSEVFNFTAQYYLKNDRKELLKFLESNFTDAQDCNYKWRIKILDLWASFLVEENRISEAKDKLKESIYLMKGRGSKYEGNLEYFSFRTINQYALDDLKNQRLSLSSPTQFNDPIDTPIITFLKYNTNPCSSKDEERFHKLRLEVIRDHIKIRCFCRNFPIESSGGIPKTPKEISELEKKYNNMRYSNIEEINTLMWSHYANGHKGMCIEYSLPSNFVNNNDPHTNCFTMLASVNYTNELSLSKSMTFIEEGLFTKSSVWRYENETRLVHYDFNCKNKYKPLPLPDKSVKAIYFGLKCSKKNINKVFNATKGQNIEFFRMVLDTNNLFKLKAKKISPLCEE